MKNIKILSLRSGFTLIELLVVIAIIGVLSAIVLSSLNSSRIKGNDAKSKSQAAGARAAAELYYSNQTPSSYGASVVGNEAAGTSIGPGCATGMFASANLIPYTLTANYPSDAGSAGKCTTSGASATGYTLSVKLNAASTWWCVDSSGYSKSIGALPGNNAVAC